MTKHRRTVTVEGIKSEEDGEEKIMKGEETTGKETKEVNNKDLNRGRNKKGKSGGKARRQKKRKTRAGHHEKGKA